MTDHSFAQLQQLWKDRIDAPACDNPQCRRVAIHADNITITNLIVTGELPAEVRDILRASQPQTPGR